MGDTRLVLLPPTSGHLLGDVGPGQFKLDPYIVSWEALHSVVKEVIYEANIYNSNIPEIINAYTERNKTVVPLLNKLIEIQKQRKRRIHLP